MASQGTQKIDDISTVTVSSRVLAEITGISHKTTQANNINILNLVFVYKHMIPFSFHYLKQGKLRNI